MKRILIILLFISVLFVTACNKDVDISAEVNYDDNYYQVYSPYKAGVANNYVMSIISNNYEIEEVELSLMNLSKKYFKTNNTYYQSGQYLTEDILKNILSKEMLNKTDDIIANDVNISPKYISYIYEQNYLSNNGNIKGMSLALVLNPYQEYTNPYGTTLYKGVDENVVVNFGKEKAKELIKYIRNIESLSNIRIVVGLYVLSSPNSILPGDFSHVGITSNNEINFNYVNYKNYYLDDEYISNNDIKTYNNYKNLQREINSIFPKLYTVGKALYIDNKLSKIEITVTSTYLNKNEILMLSNLIGDNIVRGFNADTSIRVCIKSNNELQAMILKKSDSLEAKIHIMKG